MYVIMQAEAGYQAYLWLSWMARDLFCDSDFFLKPLKNSFLIHHYPWNLTLFTGLEKSFLHIKFKEQVNPSTYSDAHKFWIMGVWISRVSQGNSNVPPRRHGKVSSRLPWEHSPRKEEAPAGRVPPVHSNRPAALQNLNVPALEQLVKMEFQ